MKWRSVIAVAGLLAGVAAAALALFSDREPSPTGISAALALVVTWSYVGSGLVTSGRPTTRHIGAAMLFIGFAWSATFLADAESSLLFTIGVFVEALYLAGFVYLILSFPSGRLAGRLDRALVASAVMLTTVVQLAWMVFADSQEMVCSDCPDNALEITRNDALAEAILQTQRAAGFVLSLFTIAVLVRRWSSASAALRRAVMPVLWTGTAIFVALTISIANDIADEPLGPVPTWVLWGVFAALPIAVLAVLLQRRLARGAVADLVVDVGTRAEPVDLQPALRRALGDPSLELAYWVPATSQFVDALGSTVALPGPGEARVATLVQRDGETVAALIHDPALRENPELVDSACAAAALTLDNERLRAELLARLAELQASRARLVEATDRERRRLERDLHDGTQQRLVSVAMTLALAESRLARDGSSVEPVVREAKQALAVTLDELRRLTQGLRPAVLIERGLAAALDDLARRSPLVVRSDVRANGTLPESVEDVAYYVASEALTNAVKHSGASDVRLRAWRDGATLVVEVADDGTGGAVAGDRSGLRGLADRVEALGGRLRVSSPPGGGTTVRAEIPCV